MDPVYCPCCHKRLFDSGREIKVLVAVQSNSNKDTADIALKCVCKNVIAVRFPRQTSSQIQLAHGIEPHSDPATKSHPEVISTKRPAKSFYDASFAAQVERPDYNSIIWIFDGPRRPPHL